MKNTWEIFKYELTYQVGRPWVWLILVILLLVNFMMTRDGGVAEALYIEFFINSSFNISKTTVFGGLLWLLLGAVIAGEAAARDVASGMHPLVYSMPIRKGEYLAGRFLAALTLNAMLLLSVQIAILLALYLPGVPPEMLGPFRPSVFLTSFFYLSIPNVLFVTAIQFSFALRSGRPISSYFASLVLFFTAYFIASLIKLRSGLGTLLDPIGVHFIWSDLSHDWTTTEKSWRVLALKGTILQNRVVWLGIGFAVAAIAYYRFSFAHRVATGLWRRFRNRKEPLFDQSEQSPVPSTGTGLAQAYVSIPHAKRSFGFKGHKNQVLAIAWKSFRKLATSWVGLFLLIFIPLVSIVVVIDQMMAFGTPLLPLTSRVVKELTGPLAVTISRWVIIPGFIIFFAGELVWREREAGVGEITDAMPGSDWSTLIGKFVGLCLMIMLFIALLMSAGILAQTILGYGHYEIGLYLKMMFGFQLTEYVIFAALVLTIHIVVDQKYIGHVVAILIYAFMVLLASMMGVEHNMLIFGAGPWWSYTEMRGFGTTIGPWLWFKLYWMAWVLILGVAAKLFIVRGREKGMIMRMRIARQRFNKSTALLAGTATVLVITIGGYIFYNTNVLNDYSNRANRSKQSAEYERRYSSYSNRPQPELKATNITMEIYPVQSALNIRGTHLLVNATTVEIDSILLAAASVSGVTTKALSFDRKASLVFEDKEFGHQLFTLDDPLKPGDTLRLGFEVDVEYRGFTHEGNNPYLMKEGSFFTHAWFPAIGYQRQRELISPSSRLKHGLPPRPVVASLYEVEDADVSRGEDIEFEATLVTDEDQVAVAPGKLLREWTQNGRHYFHYSASAPIGTEWNFFSANYKLMKEKWTDSNGLNEVTIQIFHHPQHTGHLDRMIRSIKASLDFYSEHYRPYEYDHLTVVENPGAPGNGMHASASMFYHGQAVPFWHPEGENSFDLPYAVVGHEMGHLFGVPYAIAEGAPFLAEGLAWFFSMQMVRESRGEQQLKRLLAFMRLPYPFQPIRRGEPLLRGLDPYMSYRKGPLAMHTLTEYAGADSVNMAIKRMMAKHQRSGSSGATTLDLYRELQAVVPDSAKYLLHDLFEVNTYWDFETNKVTAVRKANNEWEVTLNIRARKLVYDSAGTATEMKMEEWIPIGVFATGLQGQGWLSAPLYVQKHFIRSGEQTITVTVKGEPVRAGIDPYHILDIEEKESDENIREVIKDGD